MLISHKGPTRRKAANKNIKSKLKSLYKDLKLLLALVENPSNGRSPSTLIVSGLTRKLQQVWVRVGSTSRKCRSQQHRYMFCYTWVVYCFECLMLFGVCI